MGVIRFLKNSFTDMKESAKAQHEVDKANLAATKAESRAQFQEARAMSRRDTRLALEKKRRDEQIAEANARRAAAEKRLEDLKK